MIEISLGSILVIAGLLATFFGYVASVSYRLGKMENRVENNQNDIGSMREKHATKDQVQGIKESLDRLENSIAKLFDRDYERNKT